MNYGIARKLNLKTSFKENANGAETRKHLRILKILARDPGPDISCASADNGAFLSSKAAVILDRCAILEPATAVFRFNAVMFARRRKQLSS
jgi:hypothetical protein